MINSVGEYQKSSANSIANLCSNLFGYLPAPSIYGMIAAITKEETPSGGNKSRVAMACLLYSTIFTVSLLIYGINKKIELDEDQRGISENDEEMMNLGLINKKNQKNVSSPSSCEELTVEESTMTAYSVNSQRSESISSFEN
jgi:hypothetical protein